MPVPCSAVCKLQYAIFGMDKEHGGAGRNDEKQHGDADGGGLLPKLYTIVPPIGSRV